VQQGQADLGDAGVGLDGVGVERGLGAGQAGGDPDRLPGLLRPPGGQVVAGRGHVEADGVDGRDPAGQQRRPLLEGSGQGRVGGVGA
jgi:hypothetical protein